MEESIIDRVAKALFQKTDPKWDWDNSTDFIKEETREFARYAIETMREPTEAMVIAGVHHDNMGDMAGRWKAMIDAALSTSESIKK